MGAYSLQIATVKQITAYPLTNRTRRQLNFYNPNSNSAFITAEMMLMNSTQLYDSTVNIQSRKLVLPHHNTDKFTIGGTAWGPYYVSTLAHNKLVLPTHMSVPLTIPTSGTSVTYTPQAQKKVKNTNYISEYMTLASGAQPIAYTSAHSKTEFMTLKHRSDTTVSLSSSLSLEYTPNESDYIKFSDTSVFKSNKLKLLTNAAVLNYGGDNTFYSLNGFFNLFKYTHWDLMNTTYHIMISNTLINMYNQSMVCIESHKAGYKKIKVNTSLMKDENGQWLDKSSLPHMFYEDQFVFYDHSDRMLYKYNFDTLQFIPFKYYNLDSNLMPLNVDLFLDPLYKMPYIMTDSSEATNVITQQNESWNFMQLNNLKLISNYDSLEEASQNYIHEVFIPTSLFIHKVIFRYKDSFIILASRGSAEYAIYQVDLDAQATFKNIFTYNGSLPIYSEFPYIYYSEHGKTFTSLSGYSRLVKFDLELMDFTVIDIDHLDYKMFKDTHLWHLYKKSSNNAYYLYRDDEPSKVINISVYLGLTSEEVIHEFMVFNEYDIYILTSDRSIKKLNVQTMQISTIVTSGTPILFIRFTPTIGCVVTRKDDYLYFEELQPIRWSSNPLNWITPYDMRKGERLLPYQLCQNVLHKRLAPIISVANYNVVERISDRYIDLEIGLPMKLDAYMSESLSFPVRVGITAQTIVGNNKMSNVNPKTYGYGALELSKSLETTTVLNNDETFTISIDDLPIPETLQAGFKIYEK